MVYDCKLGEWMMVSDTIEDPPKIFARTKDFVRDYCRGCENCFKDECIIPEKIKD